MVGLFNQIEKNCDIILQKILFVDKILAMNAVKMEKQTDKMMSTLIAIIGLIAVLIFCFVCNSINRDFSDLYAPIRRFDVFYYEKIAEAGYNISGTYFEGSPDVYGMWNGMSVWAFFPLVPLCVKLLNILTFGLIDNFILAVMLSTVCMGVMIYFLIRFLRLKKVEINYFLIAVLFVFNTYFLLYFNFYTEAMFMMLIAIFLYLCEEKKFLSSGIVLAFLTATRVTGVFFIFYLFYKIYQQIDLKNMAPKNKFAIFFKKVFNILKNPYYFASLIVSFLGLAAFIIILKCCFNLSPLAFVDAQVGWGKTNTFFAYNIFVGFTTLFNYYNSFFASTFVVLNIIFCFYLIFKQKQYFVPIFMLCYIVFITSSSVISADRYIWDMLLLSIEFYKLIVECFNPKTQTKQKKAFGILSISLVLLFCVVASCLIGAEALVFY